MSTMFYICRYCVFTLQGRLTISDNSKYQILFKIVKDYILFPPEVGMTRKLNGSAVYNTLHKLAGKNLGV